MKKTKVFVAIASGVEFKGVAMENLKMGAQCRCYLRTDGVLEIRKIDVKKQNQKLPKNIFFSN